MCGIVGIVSADEVAPVLVKSIARLEYRGYDSCGVATLNGSGIEVACRQGLACVRGNPSIARTRWSTHGGVSQANAHPHLNLSCDGSFAVVHNGIITNHSAFGPPFSARGTASPQEPTRKLLRICIVRNFDRLQSFANSVMIA
jgi:glucosamine--fructose-6-phosphate aminotransferase (isomerizing)